MPWFAVYEDATGRLVSIGTVVADPLPTGLLSKEYVEDVRKPRFVWNETTKDFDIVTPPRERIPLFDFKRKFTVQEWAQTLTLTDTDATARARLNIIESRDFVADDAPLVNAFLNSLVTAGILTPARKTEIQS